MKTSLFLSSALGVILLTGTASAAVTKYKATLNGAQEAPNPVTTAATGTADLDFDDADKSLKGTVTFTGLTATGAHIHKAACGAAGGVAVALDLNGADPIDVDATLDDAQIADLIAGNLYVNLHSAANDGGEIRGQLYLEGSANQCPAASNPDAGTDAGSTSSSGTSGASSSSGTSGASSSGTSGTSSTSSGATVTPTEDDEGCSTTGTAPGSGLAIAFGVGLAVAAISSRTRRKQK